MIKIKNSWDQITLGDFIELDSILKSDVVESLKIANILSILTGLSLNEIKKIPVSEIRKLIDVTKFLNDEMEEAEPKKQYVLNGHVYNLKLDISNISTAQYVDFQSYIKMAQDDNLPVDSAKILSVWLVPEGHQYGDGYKIEDVWTDIYAMNIRDAQAVNFFLLKQCEIFTAIFLDYSMRSSMKEMKMDQKKIEEIMAPLDNMELFRL